MTKGKEMKTYLESITGLTVNRPVVINIETDQAQNCEVEEDLPAWHDSAVAVHPLTPTHRYACFLDVKIVRTQEAAQQLLDLGVFVAAAQFIREEHTDVEEPRCADDVLSRQLCGNRVVEIEDNHDLEHGEAMKCREERERKGKVKGDSLLQLGLSSASSLRLSINETCLDLGRELAELLIDAAQSWVQGEQREHIWNVVPELAILVVGDVDLAPGNPAWLQPVLKFVVLRVGCYAFVRGIRNGIWKKDSRLDTS